MTWKVLENHLGPGKSWKLKLKVQGDHLSGKPGNVRNLKHVREMSGIMLTVREMSGKKSCHGKVSQNCSLLDEY